jgi:hypothetical protein
MIESLLLVGRCKTTEGKTFFCSSINDWFGINFILRVTNQQKSIYHIYLLRKFDYVLEIMGIFYNTD